jgi:hypothetical protein
VLGVSLIVLLIAQHASDQSNVAFERAARRALGRDADIQIQLVSADPPDDESIARAGNADGVVELTWAPDGSKARVHCYLRREARWVDREISFGAGTAGAEREVSERGRLLGFAVATMFTEEQAPDTEPDAAAKPAASPAPPKAKVPPKTSASPKTPAAGGADDDEASAVTNDSADTSTPRYAPSRRSIEFAGIASSGLAGTASGLGATAGLRLAWLGPLWGRLFVSGRTGNIPKAQASTRTAMVGAGLALAALPEARRFELGLRLDAFASYFDAAHLSEDDTSPDLRSRWLPGGALLVEGGIHLGGGTGLFLGGGLEALLGKTEVYTHGTRVAVVPPFRAVGEFGFRTKF